MMYIVGKLQPSAFRIYSLKVIWRSSEGQQPSDDLQMTFEATNYKYPKFGYFGYFGNFLAKGWYRTFWGAALESSPISPSLLFD